MSQTATIFIIHCDIILHFKNLLYFLTYGVCSFTFQTRTSWNNGDNVYLQCVLKWGHVFNIGHAFILRFKGYYYTMWYNLFLIQLYYATMLHCTNKYIIIIINSSETGLISNLPNQDLLQVLDWTSGPTFVGVLPASGPCLTGYVSSRIHAQTHTQETESVILGGHCGFKIHYNQCLCIMCFEELSLCWWL